MFDRPASPVERAAPVVREPWCWVALLPALALVLDAVRPLPAPMPGMGVTLLDVAAFACIAWATLGSRRSRRDDWHTPVDGPVISGLVLAVLHVVHAGGALEPIAWLRQITASGICFYTLGARLRREPRPADAIWPGFALVVLVLSAWVLALATQGASALQQASLLVDARWVSRYGMVKALLLGTLLCAGRASEPEARALWRAIALVGAVACAVCWFAGGSGLSVDALASLDEPFYFGTSIVALMFLAGLMRLAWGLAGERAAEAGRWRAAALAFPLIATLLLFGGSSGGEGLRALAALAGAGVVAARFAPAEVARQADPRRDPPARRAA